MTKRSYKEAFLDVGFTSLSEHDVEKPQCVICNEVLSNESLKMNKLRRHLEKRHPESMNKDREFFKRREVLLKKTRLDFRVNPTLSASKQIMFASYLVALRIAKTMKPHTIGEQLVKPAALEMVKIVCGDEAAKKLQSIPLSDNTVRSRIIDMSLDIKENVLSRMKRAGKWSFQLDESTDIGNDAQLMVFVRFEGEVDLEEEFLLCTPFKTTTTGADIFNTMNDFHEQEGLSWSSCMSLCTDGAPAMLGVRQGFTARVQKLNPEVKIVHCLLHRENLASQHLSQDLSTVMRDVVTVVNFIKGSATNSRLFEQMCVGFEAQYKHLLFYSNVRWLSRGKVLRRVIDLRMEIKIFLEEKKHQLAARFNEKHWMLKLCYLNDIFAAVNELNISMQGRSETILDISEKMLSFKAKLKLWKGRIVRGKTAAFPALTTHREEWEDEDPSVFSAIQPVLVSHLEQLSVAFDRYIPDTDLTHQQWVRNPFRADVGDLAEDVNGLQEELIEIQHDGFYKQLFSSAKLGEFWTSVKKEKPTIGTEAMKVLLPFATTYLCEQGFSALTTLKTKARNRLDCGHDMRIALTKIEPRIDLIIKEKLQLHQSH